MPLVVAEVAAVQAVAAAARPHQSPAAAVVVGRPRAAAATGCCGSSKGGRWEVGEVDFGSVTTDAKQRCVWVNVGPNFDIALGGSQSQQPARESSGGATGPQCASTMWEDAEGAGAGAAAAPNECIVCGRSFRSPANLQAHLRTHTGESCSGQPFKCDECGKTFHAKSQLTSHMRTHTDEGRRF